MTDGLWAADRRALTVGLAATITFVAAEALAVVTVMPLVARDLHGLSLYGFVFSAFMLGTVVGIVAAGRAADRRGPAIPYVTGIVVFGAGLTVAGLAPSMPVLVAGRVLQGLGAGAVPAVAYAAIGRSLPERLRARMMAVLSTAWVAPGLAGPALSAEVSRAFGWRWIFLGLLPFVALTAPIALPALVKLGRAPDPTAGGHRLIDGVGGGGRRGPGTRRPDAGGRLGERRRAGPRHRDGVGRRDGLPDGSRWRCARAPRPAAALACRDAVGTLRPARHDPQPLAADLLLLRRRRLRHADDHDPAAS